MTKLPLEGQRILVTGASRGIGRAIAEGCLAAGAATVGVGFHASSDAAQSLLAEFPERTLGLEADLHDPQAASDQVQRFVEAAGGIDALVLNAGVNHPGLLLQAPLEKLEATLRVNLLAPLVAARAALEPMLRARRGTLLFVSSVAALRPSKGQCAYAASKGGIESLVRALGTEVGRKGIRVVGLRPGPTETDMFRATAQLAGDKVKQDVPLRRFAQPSEIAAAACYLLGPEASYVHGTIHGVDGGYAG
jgi:3-oxoacyl-[acyl-carrier protein] reductase